MTRSAHEAEDTTQDAFIKLWGRWDWVGQSSPIPYPGIDGHPDWQRLNA
jgi:DNA-directed RNA polymerase specialized sigma24 family protein